MSKVSMKTKKKKMERLEHKTKEFFQKREQ
jgi:hypothetical protein